MALVDHVLLASFARSELLRASETQLPQVNPFSQVSQQAFQVDQALNVQYVKPMAHPHMVNVAFDPWVLLIAEQANAKAFQCGTRSDALQIVLL